MREGSGCEYSKHEGHLIHDPFLAKLTEHIEYPIYAEGGLSAASPASWRQRSSEAKLSRQAEQRESKLLPASCCCHCHREDITVRHCMLNVFASI